MTEYPPARWQWWISPDEERWDGPHGSRQDAIDRALSEHMYTELDPDPEDGHPNWRVRFWVQEGVRPEVADMAVDGEDLLNSLDDQYEEWSFEDALFARLESNQIADLSKSLTEALHAWAKRHDIYFSSWCFADSRNEEEVTLPHPKNKDAAC